MGGPTRVRGPMRSKGTEQLVVAMKSLNRDGAYGLDHQVLLFSGPVVGRADG
jgi:hypothetical protein